MKKFKITAAEKKMVIKRRKIRAQDDDSGLELIDEFRGEVESGAADMRSAWADRLEFLGEDLKQLKNQKPYKQFAKVEKTYTVFLRELEKLGKTLKQKK